jgi:uncharacterized protein DUF6600/FecR-like protein
MTMVRRFGTALMGALLLFSAVPARAQAEDPEAYGDGYQAGDYGRVRFADNGVSILRAESEDRDVAEEAGTVNSPLFPGDSLRTDRDQRAELQLANGVLVRVNVDSDLALQSLPSSGASYQDNAVLRLSSGTVQILAERLGKDEFRIDTPSASVYLLGAGEFRIDVDGRGQTSVTSIRGVAEAVGEGGSVLVRGGMRTFIDAGAIPDEPSARSSYASDPFDHWCSTREGAYEVEARAGGDEYLEDVPDEVQPYYDELSANGEWRDVPGYGPAWSPSQVDPGWRPYVDGYWSYGPGGYFWVSNEPWGWAPYHYGRWQFVSSYGWCWFPGSVFAGAWVSWSWGPLYVGWAPLDFWGRPCFYGALSFGFYDPHCWTFVSYQHIVARDFRRFAVPVSRIGTRLRDHVVVTRPPRVGPRRLANAPDWRDRAVRDARQDTRARMQPIDRDRRPQSSMRDQESRMRQQRPNAAPARRTFDPRDRQTAPSSPRFDRRPSEQRPSAGSGGAMHRPYPRQLLVDPRSDERRRNDVTPRTVRPDEQRRNDAAPRTAPRTVRPDEQRRNDVAPRTAPRTVRPDEQRRNDVAPRTAPRTVRPDDPRRDDGASRPTSDRVREMYRNLSQPRAPREREQAAPARPYAGPRQQAPQRMSPAPRQQQPPRATAPRPQQNRPSASPRPQQRPQPQAPQKRNEPKQGEKKHRR